MSFRGGRGGRGGGRGGRGGRGGSNFNFQAKHTPHEDFPEITLPEMTCAKFTKEEGLMITSTLRLEEFMRTSCYHLEPDAPKKKNDDKEIERFSDRTRKTRSKREALASYLKLTKGNFPEELLKGYSQVQPVKKKLRWDKDSDEKFEQAAKLEAMHKDGENKTEKDDEDEDDEEEEEVEKQESSDDDYNQNVEFDDDDDDWNQEAEAHEDCYD